jgi:hypothetical protein
MSKAWADYSSDEEEELTQQMEEETGYRTIKKKTKPQPAETQLILVIRDASNYDQWAAGFEGSIVHSHKELIDLARGISRDYRYYHGYDVKTGMIWNICNGKETTVQADNAYVARLKRTMEVNTHVKKAICAYCEDELFVLDSKHSCCFGCKYTRIL